MSRDPHRSLPRLVCFLGLRPGDPPPASRVATPSLDPRTPGHDRPCIGRAIGRSWHRTGAGNLSAGPLTSGGKPASPWRIDPLTPPGILRVPPPNPPHGLGAFRPLKSPTGRLTQAPRALLGFGRCAGPFSPVHDGRRSDRTYPDCTMAAALFYLVKEIHDRRSIRQVIAGPRRPARGAAGGGFCIFAPCALGHSGNLDSAFRQIGDKPVVRCRFPMGPQPHQATTIELLRAEATIETSAPNIL